MKKGYCGILWFLIPLVLVLSSCDPYQKILKSTDFDLKYSKVKEYYNNGEYSKALPLFEELMAIYKGTKDVEKLYYFYAYSHYGQGDYFLASFYFKNFLDYYPKSAMAEDAQYMIGYSHYKMSPRVSLEQDNTQKAVDALQLFINAYPYSERVEDANSLIDELRAKMEEKAFNSAFLYYRMSTYQAATTAFKNLLLDFPETNRKEEINFLILKSNFLLAENSIVTKRYERYGNTIDAYLQFIDAYPQSEHLREAERFYDSSLINMKKYKDYEQLKKKGS